VGSSTVAGGEAMKAKTLVKAGLELGRGLGWCESSLTKMSIAEGDET